MSRFCLSLLCVLVFVPEAVTGACEPNWLDADFTIKADTTALPCEITGNLILESGLTAFHADFKASDIKKVGKALCLSGTSLAALPVFSNLDKVGSGTCTSGLNVTDSSMEIYNNAELTTLTNPLPKVSSVPGNIVIKSNPKMTGGALGESGSIENYNRIYNRMRVVLLFDISPNMGNELATNKALVAALVDTIKEVKDMQVDMVVVPFTEYGNGCFANYFIFDDPDAANTFVQAIELGKLPADPTKSAITSGDEVNTHTSLSEIKGSGYTEIVFPFPHSDYITGTVKFPSGFSPAYSIDGGKTFRDVEPLSGITHIKVAGAIAPVPGMVADIPEPTAGSIAKVTSGGDGFEPLIMGSRVFNVYHHWTNAQLICLNTKDGTACSGYPFEVNIPSKGYASTANSPVGYSDVPNQRIYFPATTSSDHGFVCVEVAADANPTFCSTPMHIVGSGHVLLGWGYPDYARLRSYAIPWGSTTVHCLDLSDKDNLKNCEGFPYTAPLGQVRVQVMPKTTKIIGCTHGHGSCYCADTLNSPTTCSGHGTISTYMGQGQPTPIMDDRGIAIGYCLWGGGATSGTWKCHRLSDGGEDNLGTARELLQASSAAAQAKQYGAPMDTNHCHLAFYEAKTYVQVGHFSTHNYIHCYDGVTGQKCNSNYPLYFSQESGTYGLSIDPTNNGGCVWALGDRGVMSSRNTIDGGACSGSDPVFYVRPLDSYCSGTASVSKWKSVSLLHTSSSDYTSATLKVQDTNNNEIFTSSLGSGDSVVNFSTQWDISGVYEKLKFTIVFDGAASDLFTRSKKPQLDVRWDGDAMEVCVTARTTIKPQFCTYDGHASNALLLMKDLSVMPTLSFLYTNNEAITTTQEQERRDAFKILDDLNVHFEGLLTMNVITPTTGDASTYGYFAQETGGMLLHPQTTVESTLVTGLQDIVKTMLNKISLPDTFDESSITATLDAFKAIKTEGFDKDSAATASVTITEADANVLLKTAVKEAAKVVLSTTTTDSLTAVGGDIVVEDNSAMTDFKFDTVQEIEGDLQLKDNDNIEWNTFNVLEKIVGTVESTDTVKAKTCADGLKAVTSGGFTVCLCNSDTQTLNGGSTAADCVECKICGAGYSTTSKCTAFSQAVCVKGTKNPSTAPTSTPTLSPVVAGQLRGKCLTKVDDIGDTVYYCSDGQGSCNQNECVQCGEGECVLYLGEGEQDNTEKCTTPGVGSYCDGPVFVSCFPGCDTCVDPQEENCLTCREKVTFTAVGTVGGKTVGHCRCKADESGIPEDSSCRPSDSPTMTPTALTSSPTNITSSPTYTTDSPTPGTGAPTFVTFTPTKITISPTDGTGNPTTTTMNPTNSTTAPTDQTTSPTPPTGAPSSDTDSPTVPSAAPTNTTGAPSVPTHNPTIPTGAPTTVTQVPTTGAPSTPTTNPTIAPTKQSCRMENVNFICGICWKVTGDFKITSKTAGLPCLVDGNLYIEDWNTNLLNTTNLQHITGALVMQCTDITDMPVFSKLYKIGKADVLINVNGCHTTTTTTRPSVSLLVRYNDKLKNWPANAFPDLTSMEGDMNVQDNTYNLRVPRFNALDTMQTPTLTNRCVVYWNAGDIWDNDKCNGVYYKSHPGLPWSYESLSEQQHRRLFMFAECHQADAQSWCSNYFYCCSGTATACTNTSSVFYSKQMSDYSVSREKDCSEANGIAFHFADDKSATCAPGLVDQYAGDPLKEGLTACRCNMPNEGAITLNNWHYSFDCVARTDLCKSYCQACSASCPEGTQVEAPCTSTIDLRCHGQTLAPTRMPPPKPEIKQQKMVGAVWMAGACFGANASVYACDDGNTYKYFASASAPQVNGHLPTGHTYHIRNGPDNAFDTGYQPWPYEGPEIDKSGNPSTQYWESGTSFDASGNSNLDTIFPVNGEYVGITLPYLLRCLKFSISNWYGPASPRDFRLYGKRTQISAFDAATDWELISTQTDQDENTATQTYSVQAPQAYHSYALVISRNRGHPSTFVGELNLQGYTEVDHVEGLWVPQAGGVFGANADEYTDFDTGFKYTYKASSVKYAEIDNGNGVMMKNGAYNAFDRGLDAFPLNGPGQEDGVGQYKTTQYWESDDTFVQKEVTNVYGDVTKYGETPTSTFENEVGEWVQVYLPYAIKPDSYTYLSTSFTATPRNFKLFGQNPDDPSDSGWVLLDTQTDVEGSTVFNTFSTRSIKKAYSRFTFVVSKTNGHTSLILTELLIAGTKENSCDTWDLYEDWPHSTSTNPNHPWKPTHSYNLYNTDAGFKRGTDLTGVTCQIQGQQYDKCFAMKPTTTDTTRHPLGLAQLWFNLNETYPYVNCKSQFRAFIGLQDDTSCGATGEVTFYVKVTGALIFKTVKRRIGGPGTYPGAEYIDVPLPPNAEILQIEVDYADQDNQCDYAIIGNPTVTFCGCVTSAPTPCPVCAKGTFAFRKCACENCRLGKYQPLPGKDSCIDCPTCPAGKYRTRACRFDDIGECTDCAKGKYTNHEDQWKCKECKVSTVADAVGQSKCRSCLVCKAGKYNNPYCTAEVDSTCTDCPAGKYQTMDGQYGCVECPTCKAGEYETTKCGLAIPLGCSTCTKCAKGKYRTQYCDHLTDNTQCKDCPAGKYQGSIGEPACKECAVGKFSKIGKAECTTCLEGTFTTLQGTENCTTCSVCPAGKYIVEKCTPTQDVVCADCNLRFTYSTTPNSDRCLECGTCNAGKTTKTDCTLTEDRVCTDCIANCAFCNNMTTCDVCSYGYGRALDKRSCVHCENENPPRYFASGDQRCKDCTCYEDTSKDPYKKNKFCKCLVMNIP